MTNKRFEELQSRAKRYMFVRFAKITLLLALFLALVATAFLYLYPHESATKPVVKPIVKPIEENTTITVKVEPKKQEPITQIIAEPIEKNTTYDTAMLALALPQITQDQKVKVPQEKEPQDASNLNAVEEKPFALTITNSDREQVLLRDFSTTKSFESALDLARLYFAKKIYEKAIYWSKEASRARPNADEPWVIYARSKNKLGKKDEAIKALENFLGFYSSKSALEVLRDLKDGK